MKLLLFVIAAIINLSKSSLVKIEENLVFADEFRMLKGNSDNYTKWDDLLPPVKQYTVPMNPGEEKKVFDWVEWKNQVTRFDWKGEVDAARF